MPQRKIVIIGAGIVGVGLADELSQLGHTNITVVDKGPLFATGGSTSHAPGLVSRTSTSKFLSDTADVTIRKFQQLSTDEGPAFPGLGTLEVAYNEPRMQELWRRHGAALSFGWQGRIIDPEEALALWPIINPEGLIGAYATDDEGLAAALRAVNAMADRAAGLGVRFVGDTEVSGFATSGDAVTGVITSVGDTIDADIVICCAGVWGPKLAAAVGLTLPVEPMEHQYAITTAIPELAANAGSEAMMPILRHHDTGIYFRDHGDKVGIGSFHHRRLPVASDELDRHERNTAGTLAFAFTDEHWTSSWDLVTEFLPPLADAGLDTKFNGVFGFTPDGYPVVGEHPGIEGLWFAVSIWITHSQGVVRMLAQTLVDGGSEMDLSPADIDRFDERELEPSFFAPRCDDQYRDIYLAHHPAEAHTSARDVRVSPFASAQRELGAHLVDVATWERPQWYASNDGLLDDLTLPRRDEWASAHWSPIAIAEHLATRRTAGLFDMTPLYRIEVSGQGATDFLLHMAAGRTDGPAGGVVYTVLLDELGGIRSDITVARLEEQHYWIGGNGPRDLGWLRRHAPSDGSVSVRFISDEVACAGLWGPSARDVLAPIADADLGNETFPYLTARTIEVGGVAAVATRISYAGELGWELTSSRVDGPALWDALWEAGREHGMVAAGRAALGTLRLEKGYRAWGTDMTPEHSPADAGLAFTARRDGSDFLGREGLSQRPTGTQRLRCLIVDDEQVVMGAEPVMADGRAVGYVTSAGYGASVDRSIAYAWLDTDIDDSTELSIAYFDRTLPAHLSPEPLFDPQGDRLRA